LKTGVKNKIFIPPFRELYELSKYIRFAIWKTFVLEKKANSLHSLDRSFFMVS